MPQRTKILFQRALTSAEIGSNVVPPGDAPRSAAAGTPYINAYVVDTQKIAVISTLAVCNTDGQPWTFYIAVISADNAGAAWNNTWWVYWQAPVPANDTAMLTLGIGLGPGDVIRVWAPTTKLNFHGFGVEDTYQGEAGV